MRAWVQCSHDCGLPGLLPARSNIHGWSNMFDVATRRQRPATADEFVVLDRVPVDDDVGSPHGAPRAVERSVRRPGDLEMLGGDAGLVAEDEPVAGPGQGGVDHAVRRRRAQAGSEGMRCRPRLEIGRGPVEELGLAPVGAARVGVVGGDEHPRRAAHDVGRRHPEDAGLGRPRHGGRPVLEVGARGRGDVPVLGPGSGRRVGDVAEEHVPLAARPTREPGPSPPRSGSLTIGLRSCAHATSGALPVPPTTHSWSAPICPAAFTAAAPDVPDASSAAPVVVVDVPLPPLPPLPPQPARTTRRTASTPTSSVPVLVRAARRMLPSRRLGPGRAAVPRVTTRAARPTRRRGTRWRWPGCATARPGTPWTPGPSSAARTGTALRDSGTMASTVAARSRAGMVAVRARLGTAVMSGKWPSFTCWSRHPRSSSTTFMSSGSSKSATGGSLKARWPFSPIPRQHRSRGLASSRAA